MHYLVDPGDTDPAVAATFGCSGITVLRAIRKVMPLEPSDPVVLVPRGRAGAGQGRHDGAGGNFRR